MITPSVRVLMCAACAAMLPALLSTEAALAQTEADQSLALLPLTSMQVETVAPEMPLAEIAHNMNTRMVDARSHSSEPEGLTLADIPLIGDVVDSVIDEEGNFDSGMDLPIDIGVGDVLGSYGMTVGIDWAL